MKTLDRNECHIEHAIRKLAQELGFFVLKMPNDCWDLNRNGAVKSLFCKERALEWLKSQKKD